MSIFLIKLGIRCAKQIVDSLLVSLGGAGGAYIGGITGASFGSTIGTGVGTLLGGPIGGAIGGTLGSSIGGLFGGVYGSKKGIEWSQALCDWLTLNFFDLPKDKAVENAFIFMNLNYHCSNQEINKRYRELCFQYHPDKGGNVQDFQKLQTSMAIIRHSRLIIARLIIPRKNMTIRCLPRSTTDGSSMRWPRRTRHLNCIRRYIN